MFCVNDTSSNHVTLNPNLHKNKKHCSVGMRKPVIPDATLSVFEKNKKMHKCMFLLLANALFECSETTNLEEQHKDEMNNEPDIDKLFRQFYSIVNTLATNDELIELKDVYPFFLKYVKELKNSVY
ncbi:hypothetical protein QTN25_009379 [Entamoeba marina]